MYDWVVTTTVDPYEFEYINYIYICDGYIMNEDVNIKNK